MSDPTRALTDDILAATGEHLPTHHDERQCEAMTALGRATWMPCQCHRRQAARQAAAAARALADHCPPFLVVDGHPEDGVNAWTAEGLRELADQLDTQETP